MSVQIFVVYPLVIGKHTHDSEQRPEVFAPGCNQNRIKKDLRVDLPQTEQKLVHLFVASLFGICCMLMIHFVSLIWSLSNIQGKEYYAAQADYLTCCRI